MDKVGRDGGGGTQRRLFHGCEAGRQANMQSVLVGLVTGICPSLKQLAMAAVKMPLLLLDEIR